MSIYENHKLTRFFEFTHLPENLQKISKPFAELQRQLDVILPDCEEKDFAMRKLLEAKDCAVRSSLPMPKPSVWGNTGSGA